MVTRVQDKNRVCPAELAGGLDNRFRRWIHNPTKILHSYVKEGMTVLDIGCGPGVYSIAMADMIGESGRVIAADLQEEMLQKLAGKVAGTGLQHRIKLHKCESDRIGVVEKVDFALAFYMVHEVPEHAGFFREIRSILKPGGSFLIIEPKFHVTARDFERMLEIAANAGFRQVGAEKVFFSRTSVLQ